jgi:hypothetical protein
MTIPVSLGEALLVDEITQVKSNRPTQTRRAIYFIYISRVTLSKAKGLYCNSRRDSSVVTPALAGGARESAPSE